MSRRPPHQHLPRHGREIHLTLLLAGLACGGLRAQSPQQPDPTMQAHYKIELPAYAFDLRQVRLLDGPFRHAQELDREYLLSLDPDRLLHTFRLNAGLPSAAEPLGGWEEPECELRGHFAGHYLTACALMYASTRDARLKAKGDAVVAGLAECQAKLGSGYLSAYPESFIDRVEQRQRVWAPYYTLHKIFAGLQDMYVYAESQEALDVCRRFADWAIARNARLSDERMQAMLGAEHGGMNETLANLYAITNDPRYLAISLRFNHEAVIGPAARRVDALTGLHANTQIPKFVGTARQYEFTSDPALRTASEFFWRTVVEERSYVIGGHSDGEHFSPKERLSTALGPSTTETCNTYNMLKLTRHLFTWDPRAEYADYYERALFNHILASQNPADGMMCYYVPLRSGSIKGRRDYGYSTPLAAFWCCTGTGVENHAKYGDSIYFHDGGSTLFVNLFIASELDWTQRGVRVRQLTRFPETGRTRLTIHCGEPTPLTLQIRHPSWAEHGFAVALNGVAQPISSRPGSYLALTRTWADEDTVTVTMPFRLRTEAFRDNPDRLAFLHGPIVLCAQVDIQKPLPVIVAPAERVLSSLAPLAGTPDKFVGAPDAFRIAGEPAGISPTLEPFYAMHGDRPYIVYWDRFDDERWRAKEEQYRQERAREEALAARTIDVVQIGHEQSERDHKLAGERTDSGEFGGRNWRHASGGGWFEYQLAVAADAAQSLLVTYWGGDAGGRVFDILVDGTPLATERLEGRKPGEFFDQTYPLPADLIRGKERIAVRFQAHAGATAGGVFGCRVLRD